MKIHEYQAKELLAKYGVPVSAGEVAFNPAEVKRIARGLSPGKKLVLKAQVHAGGRGKAGGIKIVNNPSEAEKTAESMFGMKLVTPQTGAEGKTVRRLLVTEAEEIEKEYYAGIVLDRSKNQLVYMVSKEGGVDIEKVAAEAPEKIVKEYIDRSSGVLPYQARSLAFALGLENGLFKQGVQFFLALYGAFAGEDCSLAEINPLIVTKDGSLVALDVKVNLDDNALFRHPELAQLRDYDEEDPLEVEASKHHLNYIKLNGTVGCSCSPWISQSRAYRRQGLHSPLSGAAARTVL